jgi:two-component system phosphate regulon sensor histidine kinase PhoR
MTQRLVRRAAILGALATAGGFAAGAALADSHPPASVAGGVVAAGVVLGAGAAYVAFRTVSASLRGVSRAADGLAAGNLDARVEIASGATADLTHSFNAMAERLQGQLAETAAGRARLEAVFDATTDAMIALGADTTVHFMNRAAGEILGVSPQAAMGRSFIETAHDYELDGLVRQVARRAGSSESRVVTFGHQRVPLRAVAASIAKGGDWAVLLVLNDLTEVQRLDQVRRDFLSNVSHELRTPLASIQAMVETLAEDPGLEAGDRAAFLDRIQGQVTRLGALVDELLDLSRIESGAVQLRPEEIDLGVLLAEAAGALRERAERAGVAFALPPPGAAHVEADRSSVLRIATNLLDNAVKYGPAGSTVRVEAADDGALVSLRVRDEGPGIAPADLPRVFERFYKADQSRTNAGVGLGLAIVKHLVRVHGGQVEAANAEGGGAIFTVRLPRRFARRSSPRTEAGR